MEEHRVMEFFRADNKQMWAVDGKQRIYLEWPKLSFISAATKNIMMDNNDNKTLGSRVRIEKQVIEFN